MPKAKKIDMKSLPVSEEQILQDARIGFLLYELSRSRIKLHTQTFRGLGLTRAQWWTLGNLSRAAGEKGINQTDFAKVMDVTKVSMGPMINKLEKLGYVERRPDPDDGRVWRLNLTSAGRWAIVQMWGRHAQMLPQIIEGMSPKDLDLLENLIERMQQNVHKMLSKAG